MLTSIELCAGGGGQAIGLERAGFEHQALVELDVAAAETLRSNRPDWPVHHGDLRRFDGRQFRGTCDLLAGGVPCQPFTAAGHRLGPDDTRDMFPHALRLIEEIQPRAVMLENVAGLAGPRFMDYRTDILERLNHLGYHTTWLMIPCKHYGVAQSRTRFVLFAFASAAAWLRFTAPDAQPIITLGTALGDLMGERGWSGAQAWAAQARKPGFTVVGGSKKHGGPCLGPSRSRAAWSALRVNGDTVALHAPGRDVDADHIPTLTNRMLARLQGFPDTWAFTGSHTAAWRQIGNAFPPPVAQAWGEAIALALSAE